MTDSQQDPRRTRLAQLAGSHRGILVRYFQRKGLDRAAAEDCAQECFVRLSRVELAEVENAPAYLFRVASRVYLERARRMRSRHSDMHVPVESVILIDRESSPARIFEGREALLQLAIVINKLPARTKEVFLLNRMDGLTYTQLAARFGVSVKTIEKQMSKALNHLRARLGDNG